MNKIFSFSLWFWRQFCLIPLHVNFHTFYITFLYFLHFLLCSFCFMLYSLLPPHSSSQFNKHLLWYPSIKLFLLLFRLPTLSNTYKPYKFPLPLFSFTFLQFLFQYSFFSLVPMLWYSIGTQIKFKLMTLNIITIYAFIVAIIFIDKLFLHVLWPDICTKMKVFTILTPKSALSYCNLSTSLNNPWKKNIFTTIFLRCCIHCRCEPLSHHFPSKSFLLICQQQRYSKLSQPIALRIKLFLNSYKKKPTVTINF